MDEIEIVTKPCFHCGKTTTMKVDRIGMERFMRGYSIQQAFPDYDASKRELILTGIHQKCWEKMTGGKGQE